MQETQVQAPLQYTCLENSIDRGARRATVHGVSKSQTQLRDYTFTFNHLLFWIYEFTDYEIPSGLVSIKRGKKPTKLQSHLKILLLCPELFPLFICAY